MYCVFFCLNIIVSLSPIIALSEAFPVRNVLSFDTSRLRHTRNLLRLTSEREKHEINEESSFKRRDILKIGTSSLAGFLPFSPTSASAAGGVLVDASKPKKVENEMGQKQLPLADLPMIRLQLPKAAVGREYIAVKLKINEQGPFDFMVDSGLTTELITPHLQKMLDMNTKSERGVTGLAAGGSVSQIDVVKLLGAMLCCGEFSSGSDNLPLPPLDAVVTSFPQEHIDPAHDPVEGMLGMEMLRLFDVDFDFPNGRLRLWAPGTAPKAGLVEIPAAILNETLLLGIRITSPSTGQQQQQPILGILDCGSTFSAVNWAGAELLGLPPKSNTEAYSNNNNVISATGVDGRPLSLAIPSKELELSFVGDRDPSGLQYFKSPPKNWQPWKPVSVGVGDLPIFSKVLGDGKSSFLGPAALIGLDVISQRRVIFETATGGRKRRLFVDPS